MALLAELSQDLAAIVERAGQGVVRVSARAGLAATGIVWAEDLVLTANHALEREDPVTVSMGTAEATATLAGRDPGTDLALLRVRGLPAVPLPRGKTSDLRVGHVVVAIGRPEQVQATIGIVSALDGTFRSWRGGEMERLIRTSAQFLPGFSGGPLLDGDGNLVGTNSWHYGRGVSRSLPVDTAEGVVNELAQHGRIRRAYLGIGAQPIRLAQSSSALAGRDRALLVVTVDPAGPATTAGVIQGDVLLTIDGIPLETLNDLFGALRRLEVGANVRLRLVRGGEIREVAVTAGERGG